MYMFTLLLLENNCYHYSQFQHVKVDHIITIFHYLQLFCAERPCLDLMLLALDLESNINSFYFI